MIFTFNIEICNSWWEGVLTLKNQVANDQRMHRILCNVLKSYEFYIHEVVNYSANSHLDYPNHSQKNKQDFEFLKKFNVGRIV